jgi:hypothetical protein
MASSGLEPATFWRVAYFLNVTVIKKPNSVTEVRERTIPTERPPLVGKAFAYRVCQMVSATDRHGSILGFLDRSRYYFLQVAPQVYSRAE